MVDLPLWKIWVRQLGWWHSQLNGKIKNDPNHQPARGSYRYGDKCQIRSKSVGKKYAMNRLSDTLSWVGLFRLMSMIIILLVYFPTINRKPRGDPQPAAYLENITKTCLIQGESCQLFHIFPSKKKHLILPKPGSAISSSLSEASAHLPMWTGTSRGLRLACSSKMTMFTGFDFLQELSFQENGSKTPQFNLQQKNCQGLSAFCCRTVSGLRPTQLYVVRWPRI